MNGPKVQFMFHFLNKYTHCGFRRILLVLFNPFVFFEKGETESVSLFTLLLVSTPNPEGSVFCFMRPVRPISWLPDGWWGISDLLASGLLVCLCLCAHIQVFVLNTCIHPHTDEDVKNVAPVVRRTPLCDVCCCSLDLLANHEQLFVVSCFNRMWSHVDGQTHTFIPSARCSLQFPVPERRPFCLCCCVACYIACSILLHLLLFTSHHFLGGFGLHIK